MNDLRDFEKLLHGVIEAVFAVLRLLRRHGSDGEGSEEPGESLRGMRGRDGALWGAPSIERRLREERHHGVRR